jgi:nucleoid-associated protein YgaU
MNRSGKWLVGLGLAMIAALAVWFQTRPVPEPAPVIEPATTAPATAPVAELAPAPKPVPAEPPQFDVVRVSPEGQTVLAGRAAPGQTVEILLDGEVIGTAEADATGAFAAVLELERSSEARVLTLRTLLGDASGVTVALAPMTGAGADDAAAKGDAVGAAGAKQAAAEALAETATAAAEAAAADAAAKLAAAEIATAEAAAAAAKAAAAQTAAVEPSADPTLTEAVTAAQAAAAKAAAADAASAEAGAAAAAARAAAEAATAKAVTARQATDAAAASAEPEVSRFAVSSPVIILPPEGAEQAPLLVKPESEGVTLMQPAAAEPAAGIVLDRLTYSEQGDLVAAGRGRPGSIIRIYSNAVFLKEIRCDNDGQWQVQIAADIAASALLLRFDEVDAEGKVLSRLETPFEYSPQAATHELRARKIVVQKGDYLWKFAEQYYGKGWRYSIIFSANADLIRDPDLIYPGQIFTVPELVDSE